MHTKIYFLYRSYYHYYLVMTNNVFTVLLLRSLYDSVTLLLHFCVFYFILVAFIKHSCYVHLCFYYFLNTLFFLQLHSWYVYIYIYFIFLLFIFKDAELEGVHMKRANLEKASLRNCKFEATGATHQKANLEGQFI